MQKSVKNVTEEQQQEEEWLGFRCGYAGHLVSNSGTKLTIQNIYTNTTIFNRFFYSVHITFPDSLQSNFQLPSAYPQVLQSPSQCPHSDGRAVTYYRACYSESPNSHWAKLSLTGDITGNHWMLIREKKFFFLHPPSFDNVWLGEAGWGVGTDSPHPLTDISHYMFSLSFACITVSVFGKPPPPATVGAPRPDQLGIVSHRKDSHPKQFWLSVIVTVTLTHCVTHHDTLHLCLSPL